ncbi:hypothetical protein [Mycolicibacterium sp.]|uniref:hypothetical protein n=1 Tax=Mycolicibacterium sp. TaxID=2320850 RepID=UPI0025D0EB70|nr:hypothetical protein [Mycolicibacterium sp.]MCB9408722.1 hypothetical protein [Mycolicibacterium sp.]
MRDEREQLTHLLRGLAARLEELDRALAELDWRNRHPRTGASAGEILWERTTLSGERDRLSARLGVLARQLGDLDNRLTASLGSVHRPLPTAGMCPECGYPSLGSGLCAFCRPHLAL